jgi:ectoine hydroxylase-related dioxygenase (phytanoyl-CoA dioxygenase family)
VKGRKDVPGFRPWSIKAGVLHLQPPVAVLDGMIAVHIHVDNCDESNGPVRVIPGSHLLGRLNTVQIAQIGSKPAISCPVEAGGVMLMQPLLLHACSASGSPVHRRVIHIEFDSCGLPEGMQWFSED